MQSFENLSVITKNLSIVQKNLKAFSEERLFLDEAQENATIIYFNPDSDSCGQLVVQKMSMSRISEILAEHVRNEAAAEMVETLAKTFLIDVDDADFSDWAEFFLTEPCACFNGVIPFLREKFEGEKNMNTREMLLKKVRAAASFCTAKKISGITCYGGSEFLFQQHPEDGNSLICQLFFWVEKDENGVLPIEIRFKGLQILTDYIDRYDFGYTIKIDESADEYSELESTLACAKVTERFSAETCTEAKEKGKKFIEGVFNKLEALSAARNEALKNTLK